MRRRPRAAQRGTARWRSAKARRRSCPTSVLLVPTLEHRGSMHAHPILTRYMGGFIGIEGAATRRTVGPFQRSFMVHCRNGNVFLNSSKKWLLLSPGIWALPAHKSPRFPLRHTKLFEWPYPMDMSVCWGNTVKFYKKIKINRNTVKSRLYVFQGKREKIRISE